MNSKIIFFDAGPIITLVMARLIWILPELQKKFGGKFYITPAVKYELVDRPLTVRRFEFEALQVMKLIKEGVLEVYEKVPQAEVSSLINLANNSFKIDNKPMDIIQEGEMESVATALWIGADAVVIDERTLRLFIEDNKGMRKLLERRFRKTVVPQPEKMNEFSDKLKKANIIRSIELIGVAYKQGLLDSYVPELKKGKDILVNSVLWAAKYNGCAVTEHEIEELQQTILK